MGVFSGSDQGRLLNTLNRELNTIGDTLGNLATLLAQFVQLGIYLAVPLWLNAQLTLTALGLALLFGSPFMLLHGVSYRLGQPKYKPETVNMDGWEVTRKVRKFFFRPSSYFFVF